MPGTPWAGGKPTLLPMIQVGPPMLLGIPQALGAESLFRTGFLWDFLETVYGTGKLLTPGLTPANGQSGARANSWRMGSCLSSLCPIHIGEAGTSVGLCTAKRKAWVRRGRKRNGYLLGGGEYRGSAAQGLIEDP